MNRICPIKLADVFQRIRNQELPVHRLALLKEPRLRELAWALQDQSHCPGGLAGFASDFIGAHPDAFQTAGIMKLGGRPKKGQYSPGECLQLWKLERADGRLCASRLMTLEMQGQPDPRARPDWRMSALHPQGSGPRAYFLDAANWWNLNVHDNCDSEAPTPGSCSKAALAEGVQSYNWAYFNGQCLEAARQQLAGDLGQLFFGDWNAPWYCPGIFEALLAYMDHRAAIAEQAIAPTEITRRAFRELGFAESECVPVPIVGESRFGKTTAVRVWVEARPGRRRLVTVPPENGDRAFFQAHASALGIGYSTQTTAARLGELVAHILEFSGIFIVYDEAHYLIPANYQKATPPRRLNWIRAHVMDRQPRYEVGCAFFATPQTYSQTLDRYVKVTGWNREQWFGRMAPVVCLPAELGRGDLMAVAQMNFPDISAPLLKLIAARAMRSEGYLKNLDLVAKRARFVARENGRGAPIVQDVQQALNEMLPGSVERLKPCGATGAPSSNVIPTGMAAAALQPARSGAAEAQPDPGNRLAGIGAAATRLSASDTPDMDSPALRRGVSDLVGA